MRLLSNPVIGKLKTGGTEGFQLPIRNYPITNLPSLDPSPGTETVASVISTGAPRESCLIKKSLARSGEIPRKCPVRCCLREFSPSNRRNRCNRARSPRSEEPDSGDVGDPRRFRRSSWWELPVAAWSRTLPRDLSTPRCTFPVGTRSRRRSGRDDSPSVDFERDQIPGGTSNPVIGKLETSGTAGFQLPIRN